MVATQVFFSFFLICSILNYRKEEKKFKMKKILLNFPIFYASLRFASRTKRNIKLVLEQRASKKEKRKWQKKNVVGIS